MRFLMTLICFSILLVLCWPLALLVLVFAPILWLITLPLRIFGIVGTALLALIAALLFAPARILGHRTVC